MRYDFETIGKRVVLEDVCTKLKGKSDYLQGNMNKQQKLSTLRDIEKLAKEGYKILLEL